MSRATHLQAVVEIDDLLRVVETYGVVVAHCVPIEIVVKYRGVDVICDSLEDAGALVAEAIKKHAKVTDDRRGPVPEAECNTILAPPGPPEGA